MSFNLVERNPRPGCREILVEGELDLAVADQLVEAIGRAPEQDRVLIDLGRCEFIDSTGIAVILRAHHQRSGEGGLAIYGCAKQVHRVLSVTGITDNGLVFENAEEALAGYAPAS
jgi:anti-sigma B factor antagonist